MACIAIIGFDGRPRVHPTATVTLVRGLRLVAIVGVLWCAFQVIATITGATPLAGAAYILAVVLIVPAYAAMIITSVRLRRTQNELRPLGDVVEESAPLIAITAVLVAAFVITLAASFGDPRGQAEIVNGNYVLDS